MNVEKVAEEWFDRDDDDYAALVVGFTEGWEAALPEEPGDAVIEAMVRAIKPLFLDCMVDLDAEDYAWDAARAAYAALRGAMQ